jgi:hypothetical protein
MEEEMSTKQKGKIKNRKKVLIRRLVASFMFGQPPCNPVLWQPNFVRLVRKTVDLTATTKSLVRINIKQDPKEKCLLSITFVSPH